jgi:hypothetical protein
MSRQSRRLLLVTAPLGTLLGHALAYGPLVHHHHQGVHEAHHGYLGPAGTVALVAGVAVLGWLSSARGATQALPPVRALVATQIGFFAAQEVTERLVARVPLADLVREPAVRWGVVAQAVAALLVIAAARLVRAAWSALNEWRSVHPLALLATVHRLGASRRVAVRNRTSVVVARGPPVVLAR